MRSESIRSMGRVNRVVSGFMFSMQVAGFELWMGPALRSFRMVELNWLLFNNRIRLLIEIYIT